MKPLSTIISQPKSILIFSLIENFFPKKRHFLETYHLIFHFNKTIQKARRLVSKIPSYPSIHLHSNTIVFHLSLEQKPI